MPKLLGMTTSPEWLLAPASSHSPSTAGLSTIIPKQDPLPEIWDRALVVFQTELTKDEKKKRFVKDFPDASFGHLHKAATEAKINAEQKRYRWTPVIQRIFQQINRYAVAGDMITQYNTEYTSIAWGTVRFLFLVGVEEGNTFERLSQTLESLVQILLRAQDYASLFSEYTGPSTAGVISRMQKNLTQLYAEVLNFLVRATFFVKKRALKRYFAAALFPFEAKFKPILGQVEWYEANMAKDVALLNTEANVKQQGFDDGLWLQPADFSSRLKDLKQRHVTGTCAWFLQSDSYKKWREPFNTNFPSPNLLWVDGKPGCGKSTLAMQVILDFQSSTDGIVAYTFCKSGEESKGDLIDILRNLIHQIIYATPSLHYIVRNARLGSKTPHAQDMGQLWCIFQQILDRNLRATCVIDGLDECSSNMETRKLFLNQLTNTFLLAKATAKLIVFSRLHSSELSDHSPWSRIQIHTSDVHKDIEKLVSTRLEASILSKHKEKARLGRYLVECSDGMMLWADLMIRSLEAGFFNIDRVLKRSLKDLEAVYEAILQRLSESETNNHVFNVLQLLLVAARPLRLDELAVGVALLNDMCYENYSDMGNPMQEGEDIVRRTSPLLNLMPNGTVQLAHTSLREYLVKSVEGDCDLSEPGLGKHCFELATSHGIIASRLIKYLSFDCFRHENHKEHSNFVGNSLFEYATFYLIYHVAQSAPCSKLAHNLALHFESTFGWQWLQRLQSNHDVSFGHLQLMQSDLKLWFNAIQVDEYVHNILGGLLSFLAERRYEDCKVLPEENASRLEAMSALAHSYRWHGQYEKAEEVEVSVMETRKRVLGTEHPETIKSMAEVAWAQSRQGHWSKAEPLQVQVMELSKKVFGVESLDTLRSMSDLAGTYHSQCRWSDAERLEVQVVETSGRVLGADHLDTLTSMNNLASTYEKQGRWLEAENIHVQVMELYMMALGAEHPHTLASMNNLALTHGSQGRWNEAEQLHLQVMETRRRISGAEHPETLRGMNNLAVMYIKQGRWSEAEELQVEVMAARKRLLGPEHPDTLTSMGNLATTYLKQRRLIEAEELQVQLTDIRKKVLGTEHPHTLNSMSGLALTYLYQERWNEAEQLQVQVLETRKAVLGEDHPHTLSSMNNLASTYSTQQRWTESEQLQMHVVKTGKAVLGAEHPSTLTSMNNLAETYRNQGHWSKAEELQMQVMDVRKRLLGADHPDMLTSMNNLAMIYKGADRHDEAIELMRNVVDLSTRRIGAEHPNTVKSAKRLNEWLEFGSELPLLSI